VYTLLRSTGTRELFLAEAPALGTSLVVAEACYKFHSFTLECLAFLATWLALSALMAWFRGTWPAKNQAE
jgi:hypothetical protein